MNIKILLAGDGGQGIQTIADLLTQACFAKGFFVSDIPNYGLEQRGGVSLAFVQIQEQKIMYPKFSSADLVLIMSDQARDRIKKYISSHTRVIDVKNYGLIIENINSISMNIFFLALIAKILAQKKILDRKHLFVLVKAKLKNKPQLLENISAFDRGINY